MYDIYDSKLEWIVVSHDQDFSIQPTGASTIKDPVESSMRYKFIRGRIVSFRRGVLEIVGAGIAPPGSIAAYLRPESELCIKSILWERTTGEATMILERSFLLKRLNETEMHWRSY